MLLTSPLFNDNEFIPIKFTCDGGDINPELHIQNVPEDAKGLALIMDDPDAPKRTFTHWLVWNINPKTTLIKQESQPPGSSEGATDFGRVGYGGPCPPVSPTNEPPGKPHRYFFKLYALDIILNLESGADKKKLEDSIKGHIIEETQLVGLYAR